MPPFLSFSLCHFLSIFLLLLILLSQVSSYLFPSLIFHLITSLLKLTFSSSFLSIIVILLVLSASLLRLLLPGVSIWFENWGIVYPGLKTGGFVSPKN